MSENTKDRARRLEAIDLDLEDIEESLLEDSEVGILSKLRELRTAIATEIDVLLNHGYIALCDEITRECRKITGR